jgi:hypothetical protein
MEMRNNHDYDQLGKRSLAAKKYELDSTAYTEMLDTAGLFIVPVVYVCYEYNLGPGARVRAWILANVRPQMIALMTPILIYGAALQLELHCGTYLMLFGLNWRG